MSRVLSTRIFAEGIGMIVERWNRDIPPSTSAVMAEWLAARGCTDDEFITGVKRAIAEDEWPPSARRILELARPALPPDTRAREVFDKVLGLRKYIPGYGQRLALDDVRNQLGESAHRATVAVGVSRLVGLSEEARPFVLKEFVSAFVDVETERQSRATSAKLLKRAETRRLAAGDQG